MKNGTMELAQPIRFYWRFIRTAFFRIQLFSKQGQPALQKIIDTYVTGGINPLTGNAIPLNRESSQTVAFYCEQDKAWWVSVNAGNDWSIMPTNESFSKVIRLVDIVL